MTDRAAAARPHPTAPRARTTPSRHRRRGSRTSLGSRAVRADRRRLRHAGSDGRAGPGAAGRAERVGGATRTPGRTRTRSAWGSQWSSRQPGRQSGGFGGTRPAAAAGQADRGNGNGGNGTGGSGRAAACAGTRPTRSSGTRATPCTPVSGGSSSPCSASRRWRCCSARSRCTGASARCAATSPRRRRERSGRRGARFRHGGDGGGRRGHATAPTAPGDTPARRAADPGQRHPGAGGQVPYDGGGQRADHRRPGARVVVAATFTFQSVYQRVLHLHAGRPHAVLPRGLQEPAARASCVRCSRTAELLAQ